MRAWVVAGAALLAACQASARPGDSCTRASDCTAPLVCAIGRCRAACADSRDCPTLARCIVEPSSGVSVCSLPATDDCAVHDCATGFTCLAGQCVNVCGTIVRCPDGVCQDGACIPPGTPPLDAGAGDAALAATTWTIPIASDGDDGELDPGGFYPDGEHADDLVYTGAWAGAYTRAYLRFALPAAIPSGAVIVEAHLEVDGAGVAGIVTGVSNLGVNLDDSADAPAVALLTDYPSGPTGQPSIAWTVAWGPLSEWTIGTQESPDLSMLVQPLLDRHGGLAAGAHLRFWVTAGDFDNDGEAIWHDSVGGNGGPILVITWRVP